MPDRPGTLAELLSLIGSLGANVVGVEHSRTSGRLALGEAEVALNLETRGSEHCAQLIAELRAAGYPVLAPEG